MVSEAALEEFRKKLVKYKARCFLMMHNLSAAKAEIQKLYLQDETVSYNIGYGRILFCD